MPACKSIAQQEGRWIWLSEQLRVEEDGSKYLLPTVWRAGPGTGRIGEEALKLKRFSTHWQESRVTLLVHAGLRTQLSSHRYSKPCSRYTLSRACYRPNRRWPTLYKLSTLRNSSSWARYVSDTSSYCTRSQSHATLLFVLVYLSVPGYVVRDNRVFRPCIQFAYLPLRCPRTGGFRGDPILADRTCCPLFPSCRRRAPPTHTPCGTTPLQFTYLLAGSMLFDVIWMATNSQNWFARLVTVLLLILKVSALPCTSRSHLGKLRRARNTVPYHSRFRDSPSPTWWIVLRPEYSRKRPVRRHR